MKFSGSIGSATSRPLAADFGYLRQKNNCWPKISRKNVGRRKFAEQQNFDGHQKSLQILQCHLNKCATYQQF